MEYLYYFVIGCLFIRIAVIDYREHVIYDRDNLSAAIIIMLYSAYSSRLMEALAYADITFLIGYIIFIAAYRYYGFEAFGLGDILLLAVLGLFLGDSFLHYFALSMMFDGMIALIYLLAQQKLKDRRLESIELPYAPALLVWLPLYSYFDKPYLMDVYRFLFL